MIKPAIRRAATRALVSVALFVGQTSSFTQVRSTAQERDHLAQFCAPPNEDASASRFYCWSSSG